MSKKEVHAATSFVEMQEEDLKRFLLFRYESIKQLEESQKNDEELKRLAEELREYRDSVYTDKKKAYKAELKAARSIAKARGIEFTLPKD